jgi:hypothetical protein
MVRPVDGVQVAEDRHHGVHFGRAQAGHDFVEEQNLRLGGQRAGDLEAFAFGQRQFGGGLIALAPEAKALEHGRFFARDNNGGTRLECADDDVFEDGEAGERLDDLEGAADARETDLIGAPAADILTVEGDRAFVGL